MYKWRHLVENFFTAIKEFRRIATHYDKADVSFKAMGYLISGVLTIGMQGDTVDETRGQEVAYHPEPEKSRR
jgi:hypothetical protein